MCVRELLVTTARLITLFAAFSWFAGTATAGPAKTPSAYDVATTATQKSALPSSMLAEGIGQSATAAPAPACARMSYQTKRCAFGTQSPIYVVLLTNPFRFVTAAK